MVVFRVKSVQNQTDSQREKRARRKKKKEKKKDGETWTESILTRWRRLK